MVRTRTFNPVDLERILSRPVCSRLSPHSFVVTKPRLMPEGPASRKRYRSGNLAHSAAAIWPMFRVASAR
jgi:hypothetical protein